MRPRFSPIYAICRQPLIANGLALNWGVVPLVMPFSTANPEDNINAALERMLSKGLLKKGATVVIVSSISTGGARADAVQMRVLE